MEGTDKQAIRSKINELVNSESIVLFMKGNKLTPRCGFSMTASSLLQNLGVNFKAVDVLLDETVRQGIKEYSGWPTIPQLYVNGEFIGGCDIMKEMYESGELETLVKGAA